MTFEQVFDIPRNHTLKEVKLTMQVSDSAPNHWIHEEYDSLGCLVAKYASWQFSSINPLFKSKSGFRKYNRFGQVIKESTELNLPQSLNKSSRSERFDMIATAG